MIKSVKQGGLDMYERLVRHSRVHQFVGDLNQTQWLGAYELRDLQWQRLQRLLTYAEQYVPYYQRVFQSLGLHAADLRTWQDFSLLPLLTKPQIQQHADELHSTEPACQLIPHHTGGSTGEPMHFFLSPSSRDQRIAATMRAHGWAGWQRGERVLYLWSINVFKRGGFASRKARFRDWLESRRTVNFADYRPEQLVAMINEYRPFLLVGYATPLHQLARHILQDGGLRWRPQAVYPSAETLYDSQRADIERAFACPVFNLYGCSEVGCIASECDQHDGLHVMSDSMVVELLSVPGGSADDLQQIVITDLNNFGTPFIRYQIGDLARWKTAGPCACGRHLPRFEQVAGRIMDCLLALDGRLIPGQLALRLFENTPSIQQFQLTQKTPTHVHVNLVAVPTASTTLNAELERGLRLLLGEAIKITIQRVDNVQPTASGKFRYIINEIEAANKNPIAPIDGPQAAGSTDPLLRILEELATTQRRFAAECRARGYEAFAREADTIADAYASRVKALAAMTPPAK